MYDLVLSRKTWASVVLMMAVPTDSESEQEVPPGHWVEVPDVDVIAIDEQLFLVEFQLHFLLFLLVLLKKIILN